MKKTLYLAIVVILLSACSLINKNQSSDSLGAEAYKSVMAASYETANITALPNKDTILELNDGAKVIVPAGAASEEVEIVLERNPDKAKNMPALGEYTVPVSSFYNIEPKGEGLVGPVEVQLPVDRTLIPEGMDGELVALFPDGKGGWRSESVDEVNGKAVVYTDDLGDPIIAWHFYPRNVDQVEKLPPTAADILKSNCKKKWWISEDTCVAQEFKKIVDDYLANTPLCDKRITLSVIPADGGEAKGGSQFDIVGRLRKNPIDPELLGAPANVILNLPVEISVNYRDIRETQKTFQVNTDIEGRFQLTLDASSPDSGLKEGWNWIFASATCPAGNNYAETVSKGYAEFKLQPQIEEAEEPAPTAEPTQPPEGSVAIPDVTGLSLDEAIAKLGALGFRTTWIDGKSSLELGRIYQQKPTSGEYFVPHRTTVVVYRTIQDDPQISLESNLLYSYTISVNGFGYESTDFNQILLDMKSYYLNDSSLAPYLLPKNQPVKFQINELTSTDGRTLVPAYIMEYSGKEYIKVNGIKYEARKYKYNFEYSGSLQPDHDTQDLFKVSGIAYYHNSGILLLDNKTTTNQVTRDKQIEEITIMGLYKISGEEIKLE